MSLLQYFKSHEIEEILFFLIWDSSFVIVFGITVEKINHFESNSFEI